MGLLARIQAEQERSKRGSWQVVETAIPNKAHVAPWVALAVAHKLPVKDLTRG